MSKYSIVLMCQLLDVHRSGFYAWLKAPESKRSCEDKRLLNMIKQSWLESGCAYDYRNVSRDLKDQGEVVGKNRVHRIMKLSGIRSQ